LLGLSGISQKLFPLRWESPWKSHASVRRQRTMGEVKRERSLAARRARREEGWDYLVPVPLSP
jgi:hypothetical protein